jgi:innexin
MLDKLLYGLESNKKQPEFSNFVDSLCSKVTVSIFVAFSFVLTSKQYFGDPIICTTGFKQNSVFMDTFCLTNATYSITSPSGPYAGVSNKYEGTIINHNYYQYVSLMLLVHAIIFYIPLFVWKTFEQNEQCNKIPCNKRIIRFFRVFIVCKLIYVLIIGFNFVIVSWFLSTNYLTFGPRAATNYTYEVSFLFPRIAKCSFYQYGSSGEISSIDNLCVLPLNAINDKIYMFIWIWLMFLISAQTIDLLFIALQYYSSRVRNVFNITPFKSSSEWAISYMMKNYQNVPD